MKGEKEFKKFVNVLQFQTALEAILPKPFETFKNAFVLQITREKTQLFKEELCYLRRKEMKRGRSK